MWSVQVCSIYPKSFNDNDVIFFFARNKRNKITVMLWNECILLSFENEKKLNVWQPIRLSLFLSEEVETTTHTHTTSLYYRKIQARNVKVEVIFGILFILVNAAENLVFIYYFLIKYLTLCFSKSDTSFSTTSDTLVLLRISLTCIII